MTIVDRFGVADIHPPVVLPNLAEPSFSSQVNSSDCLFPAYVIIFCVVYLLSIVLISSVGSWLKIFLLSSIIIAHIALMFTTSLDTALYCTEKYVLIEDHR